MNKINIAEILKDCPSGMELDCTMYEDVYFDYVDELDIIHCYIRRETYKTSLTFNQHGTPNSDIKSKCVIFPKGKTTWEGFVPPCKFKDGDIIFTHASYFKHSVGNTWISIFQEKRNGGVATYVDYAEDGSDYYSDLDGDKALLCMENDILHQRHATEEEKQKLFDAIKANGYRWNAETKTLEKLITPKFKVGDRIKYIYLNREVVKVVKIHDKRYELDNGKFIEFQDENAYEISYDKFNISTLKPFDKVLVRGDVGQKWIIDFFGFMDNDKGLPFVCVGHYVTQCIPYEGNEHLLDTTNDCDDFYKTWNNENI